MLFLLAFGRLIGWSGIQTHEPRLQTSKCIERFTHIPCKMFSWAKVFIDLEELGICVCQEELGVQAPVGFWVPWNGSWGVARSRKGVILCR